MPMWPADTPPPPAGVPQEPAAPSAGPAPVPYGGSDRGPADAPLMTGPVSPHMPGVDVMAGTAAADGVQQSSLAAPNVNPYYAGTPSSIYTGGDPNPAGLDDMAPGVASAVAAAEARSGTHQQATYGTGNQIGDDISFPNLTSTGGHLDPAASSPGTTDPAGGFFDPPREY